MRPFGLASLRPLWARSHIPWWPALRFVPSVPCAGVVLPLHRAEVVSSFLLSRFCSGARPWAPPSLLSRSTCPRALAPGVAAAPLPTAQLPLLCPPPPSKDVKRLPHSLKTAHWLQRRAKPAGARSWGYTSRCRRYRRCRQCRRNRRHLRAGAGEKERKKTDNPREAAMLIDPRTVIF